MTREICDVCDRESRVGFTVPDEMWERVQASYPAELGIDILCLACFTHRGDLLNLEWDRDIQFWPVSRVTFRVGEPSTNREYDNQGYSPNEWGHR